MRTIRIRTGSRLHFGLIAPAPGQPRRFGGAGVMIETPHLEIQLEASSEFESLGPAAERVREFASLWARSRGTGQLPQCRLRVIHIPPLHSGFGVGTQLGLCVARLLTDFVNDPIPSPANLAASVNRGARSAVGTYGFFLGGLIVEEGKETSGKLSPLNERIGLPDSWRWVLVRPTDHSGLHGSAEQQVFSTIGADSGRSQQLTGILKHVLLPAAGAGDFEAFSRAVFDFGYQAGLSFAHVQGGAYNGPRLTDIVARVRDLGVEGVGQSSWGPTLFALCQDEPTANRLVDQLQRDFSDVELRTSRTVNHGAVVSDTH